MAQGVHDCFAGDMAHDTSSVAGLRISEVRSQAGVEKVQLRALSSRIGTDTILETIPHTNWGSKVALVYAARPASVHSEQYIENSAIKY